MKRILTITLILLISVRWFNVNSQNTGPVAPEASSFEPVDATDMVNLVTGDLSYVIPLLNVPNPEGGFPLALSYHSGIAMDQEASWVGLGWNITPGAINRGVIGFSDDSRDAFVVGITNIDPTYYSEYTRGIELPLEIFGLPSIGLQYSFGSQRSFGGSVGYGGFSFSLNTKGSFGFGYGFGLGDSPASVGLYIGNDNFGLNLGTGSSISKNFAMSSSIGLNYNTASGSLNLAGGTGISGGATSNNKFYSFGTVSSVGFSLGSGGLSTQYRGIGMSSLMFGKLSDSDASSEILKKSSYNFILVNWSNFKVKFWAYKVEMDHTYGTLYMGEAWKAGEWNRQKYDYKQDVYSIPVDFNTLSNTDEYDCGENLIFPAYDNFNVNVQGLSGSFTPQLLKSGILTGDGRIVASGGDGKELYYNNYTDWGGRSDVYNILPKFFYFDNEPVSYASISSGIFDYPIDLTDPASDLIEYNGGQLDTRNNAFFNQSKMRKGSAKPIEWFSNDDIAKDVNHNLRSRGFIESAEIQSRNNSTLFPKDGIGAFTITDSDGKKYHFSLPVYQFEEVTRSYVDPEKGDFVERRNLGTYAYTWLLTAITGPDYVDLTGNGLSPDDYGFHVKFNYGKWTDGYFWQLPYTDLGKYKPYHWGRKQVYYLNSIQTRTHTAYFVKNLRSDAQGADLYDIFEGSKTNKARLEWKDTYKPDALTWYTNYLWDEKIYKDEFNITSSAKMHSALLLDKIVIVKNSDTISRIEQQGLGLISNSNKEGVLGGSLKSTMDHTRYDYVDNYHNTGERTDPTLTYLAGVPFNVYYQDKTLDISDIPTDYERNYALKVIKFNYDYSLCAGTPNSIAQNKGKLTLRSVAIFGKNSKQTAPPYVFNYKIAGENKFDIENKDLWGYDKNPENWSINEIINPVGSRFKITYDWDRYEKEAVYNGIVKKKDVGDAKINVINDFSGYIDYNIYPFPAFSNIYAPCSNWFRVTGYCPGLLAGKEYYLNAKIDANLEASYNRPWPLSSDEYKHSSSLNTVSLKLYNFVIDGNYFSADVYINNYWEATYIMFRNEKEFRNKDEAQMGWPPLVNEGRYIYDHFGEITIIKAKPKIENASLIFVDAPETTFGGGLRVSKVTVQDPDNTINQSTHYSYFNGVTTYAPKNYQFYVPYQSEIPSPMVYYGKVSVKTVGANGAETGRTDYIFKTPEEGDGDFKNSAFVMGTVDNYQFKVENLQYVKDKALTTGSNAKSLTVRSAKITNNFSGLGSLLQMSTYNKEGNLIGKTVNTYKTPSQINQGITQETYQSLKGLADWMDGYVSYPTEYFVISSSKAAYPTMLASTTTMANNESSRTTFDKYDFITGSVLEQTIERSNGKVLKSSIIPAYEVYPEMGPSFDDSSKWNMLTQPAATFNYVDGKLINASVQTWNDTSTYRSFDGAVYSDFKQKGVFRKHKTFSWKGEIEADGTLKNFPVSSAPSRIVSNWSFLFSGEGRDGWFKTNEITRYDHYSLPLESKDINGNFVATKMYTSNNYVLATASNSNYNSFAYTGFEESVGTEWGGEFIGLTGSARVKGNLDKPAHTGEYYCTITGTKVTGPIFTSTIGGTGTIGGRSYKASVWMHENSPDSTTLVLEVTNSSGSVINNARAEGTKVENISKNKFGKWILVTVSLDKSKVTDNYFIRSYVTVPNASVLNPAIIDDQRIQPVDAGMSAYVYDQSGNLTAILDNNNIASRFDYDDAGRLTRTWKETPQGFKKMTENKLNHKHSNFPVHFSYTPASFAVGQTVTFTANNLGAGATYTWDFGDGIQTTTSNIIQHTFNNLLYEFPVKLTVNTPDNRTETNTMILNQQYIYFSNPKRESVYNPGNVCPIFWSTNISGTFTIQYFHPGSSIYYTLKSDASPSELYNWTIPLDITLMNGYKIRITSNLTNYFYESGVFEIKEYTPPPPPVNSISILSPTYSTTWRMNQSQSISWQSQNAGTFNIKLVSADGGTPYDRQISSGTVVYDATCQCYKGTVSWTPYSYDVREGYFSLQVISVDNPNINSSVRFQIIN